MFLARHMLLGQQRAIKRMRKTEHCHELWLREALILKQLFHPAIPIIYDVEEDKEYSYLIMEYLDGQTLFSYALEFACAKGRDFTIREGKAVVSVPELALQVCRLLLFLHGQETPLLYLDLKPENLMLCTDGTVKLVDFGAALPKDKHLGHSILLGTRGYAAPELLERHKIDERCDIYSFGMLLFFLFTGKIPKRETRRIANIDKLEGIEKKWKDIINQCLRHLPGLRFSSMKMLEARILEAMEVTSEKGGSEEESIKKVLNIAGAFPHCGVTHICLSIAVYLAGHGKRVAYRETEEKGIVETLLLCCKKANKNGMPQFHGVLLLRGEEETPKECGIEIEIWDWGVVSEKSSFYTRRRVVLVCSVKCWELAQIKAQLACFTYPPALCMNGAQGKEFSEAAGYFREYQCIRFPFMPEAWRTYSPQGDKAFGQLLGEAENSV